MVNKDLRVNGLNPKKYLKSLLSIPDDQYDAMIQNRVE